VAVGSGSGRPGGRSRGWARKACNRRKDCRACTSCFQPPIICSTGASARPMMMEPGDGGAGAELHLEHEVGADAEDGDLHRQAEELGGRGEDGGAVAARCCGAVVAATESRHRPITDGSIPMLSITSALREMASARRWDAMAAVLASRSSGRWRTRWRA
jgi:hypothetical protein